MVGSIGRLNEQKGHRYLLEAAARVLAAVPAARVLIVGDGDLEAPLREQARALGIADRVVFAGHRDDIPALLGAVDVFCISSTYEGTPLTLFEAMAAGKAIVSTAVDGCREVHRGRRDRRARPAARLRRAGPAPAGAAPGPRPPRRPWREAARRASARYDIRRCVEAMQALYDEVLAERRGAA